MNGLFARMAQRARGGDAGAVRMLVPSPFDPEPELAVEPDATVAPIRTPRAGRSVAAVTETTSRTLPTPPVARRGDPPSLTSPALETTDAATDAGPGARRRHPPPLEIAAMPHERAVRGDTARDPGASLAPPASDAPRIDAVADATMPLVPRGRFFEPDARVVAPDGPAAAAAHATSSDELLLAPTAPRPSRPRPAGAAGGRRATSPGAGDAPETTRPVVKVTIGRIDVRGAPTAPAASPPRSSRHQAMGLDEYLRRRDARDGGGG